MYIKYICLFIFLHCLFTCFWETCGNMVTSQRWHLDYIEVKSNSLSSRFVPLVYFCNTDEFPEQLSSRLISEHNRTPP